MYAADMDAVLVYTPLSTTRTAEAASLSLAAAACVITSVGLPRCRGCSKAHIERRCSKRRGIRTQGGVNATAMSVQTVEGAVPASSLGATLTHEHLAMDFSYFYRAPPRHAAAALAADAVTLQTVGLLRQYPYSSRYNLRLDDEPARAAVLRDLAAYRAAGGGAVVDNTTLGLGRDLAFLRRAAAESGVRVVAGTGHYIAEMQPPAARGMTVEQIYTLMRRELLEGCCEDASVRAGFMGEIASVWPLHEMEKRAVVAAGEVQAETGHGVSFHPHRVCAAPAHIMRLYLEAGGRAGKAVMSHLERTLTEEQLLEFAELGCYCQLDLFGTECSLYQLAPDIDMPSDAQRIRRVLALVREGRADKILLSHDVHTKHRLTEFGGHGFAHILTNVVPRLEARGVSADLVRAITVDNPAEWLSVAPTTAA